MERVVNVFGQAPASQQIVIDRVKREAREECQPGSCAVEPILDECVEAAVEALWGSRIKTCVPLLAQRQVRCCIRAGSCDRGEC